MSTRCPRAVTLLFASALAACGDATGPTGQIVISGTIQNVSGVPLTDARLLVVWVVTSGANDYSYVFGEGTVNAGAGTFAVTLDQPPPAAALNAGGLGVGVLVLTTDPSLQTGDDLEDANVGDLIGAADRFGVIYIAGDPASQSLAWAAGFDGGYGMGIGEAVPGDFDRFVPTSAGAVEIRVDDWDNLDFVNWT